MYVNYQTCNDIQDDKLSITSTEQVRISARKALLRVTVFSLLETSLHPKFNSWFFYI